jgi:hypothetical protein
LSPQDRRSESWDKRPTLDEVLAGLEEAPAQGA